MERSGIGLWQTIETHKTVAYHVPPPSEGRVKPDQVCNIKEILCCTGSFFTVLEFLPVIIDKKDHEHFLTRGHVPMTSVHRVRRTGEGVHKK